ncbi:hypothetical protein DC487_14660 [Sphingobacterium corticibacter]|uniref:Uncharacterized protein n=1 Tax=Sphingobacterium corticibacter TaxID=2171749 RepID=A0A2T8HFY9_9SPHI|nr:hypothetical protein DC487_14660 [Sphingobacterium corticibacter]
MFVQLRDSAVFLLHGKNVFHRQLNELAATYAKCSIYIPSVDVVLNLKPLAKLLQFDSFVPASATFKIFCS